MSITDELREFMAGADGYELWCPHHKAELTSIADRIDAEHEKNMVDALLNDGLPMSDKVMAEHGWYRVLDADKQPIHLGDVMENIYGGVDVVEGILSDRYLVLRDNDWLTIRADLSHHHHKQTVEDVLREFAGTLASAENNWGSDVNDAIAEYAAKLQLKETE